MGTTCGSANVVADRERFSPRCYARRISGSGGAHDRSVSAIKFSGNLLEPAIRSSLYPIAVGRRELDAEVGTGDSLRIMQWVGSEVLPHEADLRRWLRRSFDPLDLEDIVQESYARIAGLDDIAHIGSGRAYLFTVARSVVLDRIRRARIVNIETITKIESLNVVSDEPSPERILAGKRELARVNKLIEDLPDRCRKIFKLRKLEGLSHARIAKDLGVPVTTVENDVKKGLRLILKAIETGEDAAGMAKGPLERDEQARDSRSDL